MNWTCKYHTDEDFVTLFDSEQDFIDFMFNQIIMFNFGVHVA